MLQADGRARPGAKLLVNMLNSMPKTDLMRRQKAAEAMLLQMGITFAVYGNDQGTEKIFPFDMIPRIVDGTDWQSIESGLKQRIWALNQFIHDIYHDKKIIKDKIIPEEIIFSSKTYRKACEGFDPPKTSGAMSPGPILSGMTKGSSMSLKTICGALPVCLMCWKTARF